MDAPSVSCSFLEYYPFLADLLDPHLRSFIRKKGMSVQAYLKQTSV